MYCYMMLKQRSVLDEWFLVWQGTFMLSQNVTCTIAAVQLFLDFQKAEEEDDRIKDKLPANSFLGVIRHSKCFYSICWSCPKISVGIRFSYILCCILQVWPQWMVKLDHILCRPVHVCSTLAGSRCFRVTQPNWLDGSQVPGYCTLNTPAVFACGQARIWVNQRYGKPQPLLCLEAVTVWWRSCEAMLQRNILSLWWHYRLWQAVRKALQTGSHHS